MSTLKMKDTLPFVSEATVYDFKKEYLRKPARLKPGTKERVYKSLNKYVKRDDEYIESLYGKGH